MKHFLWALVLLILFADQYFATATKLDTHVKEPTGDILFDEQAKAPPGCDIKLTSTDPSYGYTTTNPIKVGSGTVQEELDSLEDNDEDNFIFSLLAGATGPEAERQYLNSLIDKLGRRILYKRIGSFAGPCHLVDGYKLKTSNDESLVIYIDMYHPESDPEKQLAPMGLFKLLPAE
jgi:hypothetical protein